MNRKKKKKKRPNKKELESLEFLKQEEEEDNENSEFINIQATLNFKEKQFLNNLDILEHLGTGSYGKIYKCFHHGLNKFVAVKFIEH